MLVRIRKSDYRESKYSVESVSGKYLENDWSDQHEGFSVEFVIKKWVYDKQLQRYLRESNSTEYLDSL